jgi:hypothetical protein
MVVGRGGTKKRTARIAFLSSKLTSKALIYLKKDWLRNIQEE